MNAVLQACDLDIGIGGLFVRLRTGSPGFATIMAHRFAGFIGHVAQPDYVFDIELMAPLADHEVEDDNVRVTLEGSTWHLTCGDFDARWDSQGRHGRVRLVASPYSLDTVLRVLHTLILSREGGMLMHASSVILDGQAYAFTGVSGAGKTTISRLAPPHARLLTDEMSFIRCTEKGYTAHGTPFAGELARPGENVGAPLAGVFLLVQGPDNRIEPLSPAESVRALMANILYFARDPATTTRVFDNAMALAAAVPVRRLTFAPDARVWELIGSGP